MQIISKAEWPIKRLILASATFLLLTIVLSLIATTGIIVPFLREIISLVLLTFIPGSLALRVFRIQNIGLIETLLYSVGLSLVFNYVVGAAANFLLPFFHVARPMDLPWVMGVFSVLLAVLGLIAYLIGRRPSPIPVNHSHGKSFHSELSTHINSYLLGILPVVIAIMASSWLNRYGNPAFFFILVFIVAAVIVLTALKRLLTQKVYPVMIFSLALALVYQTTLISSNLVGSDIHGEYYISNQVLVKGWWDTTTPLLLNSCMSITLLTPLYSTITGINIVWLFKTVFPAIFAFMPLALYRVFRLQTSPRLAFLSTLFFIAMPMFTMDMAQLIRQQISELFFALVVLVLVERRLSMLQRGIMVILMGTGAIVSHYGMGTGYAGYILITCLLIILMKSSLGKAIWHFVTGNKGRLPPDAYSPGALHWTILILISVLTIGFMLAYYGSVAGGTALAGPQNARGALTALVPQGGANPWLNLLNVSGKEQLTQTALGLDFADASAVGKAWRIIQYLVEIFLIIGLIRLLLRPLEFGEKIKCEYISLIITSMLILTGLFLLPTLGYGMGSVRVWQITLMLTAPLFFFGGELVAGALVRLVNSIKDFINRTRVSRLPQDLLWVPTVFVMLPYFIFNSGAVFEILRLEPTTIIDVPYSISLSNYRASLSPAFEERDFASAGWLSDHSIRDNVLITDYNGLRIFRHFGIYFQEDRKPPELLVYYDFRSKDLQYYQGSSSADSYVFLDTWNTENELITYATAYGARKNIGFTQFSGSSQLLDSVDRIYTNGGSIVLMVNRNQISQ
jgi:uncharacterized membrane protein